MNKTISGRISSSSERWGIALAIPLFLCLFVTGILVLLSDTQIEQGHYGINPSGLIILALAVYLGWFLFVPSPKHNIHMFAYKNRRLRYRVFASQRLQSRSLDDVVKVEIAGGPFRCLRVVRFRDGGWIRFPISMVSSTNPFNRLARALQAQVDSPGS